MLGGLTLLRLGLAADGLEAGPGGCCSGDSAIASLGPIDLSWSGSPRRMDLGVVGGGVVEDAGDSRACRVTQASETCLAPVLLRSEMFPSRGLRLSVGAYQAGN